MINRDQILQDQACPSALEANLQSLLQALNKFQSLYGKPMTVTSGYRSPEHNQSVGGAPKSAHIFCMAADFHDPAGSIKTFILSHPDALEQSGLYCEDWKSENDTHIHLQMRAPASGKRIFVP